MKTGLRFSRASGSAHAKVEKAIRRGWQPGLRVRDFLAPRSRHNSKVTFVAGGGSW